MWQDKKVHGQVILALFLVFLCVFSLLFLSQNVSGSIKESGQRIHASIFFKKTVTDKQIKALVAQHCADSMIDTCDVIKPKDAKQHFLKQNPNIRTSVEQLSGNPFPTSVEMYFKKGNSNEKSLANKVKAWQASSLVDEVVVDQAKAKQWFVLLKFCLLYTSPSPRDRTRSRMPSSA